MKLMYGELTDSIIEGIKNSIESDVKGIMLIRSLGPHHHDQERMDSMINMYCHTVAHSIVESIAKNMPTVEIEDDE